MSKGYTAITRRQFLAGCAVTASGLVLPRYANAATTQLLRQKKWFRQDEPLKIEVLWRGPTNPVNTESELYHEIVERTGVAYNGVGIPPGQEYTERVNAIMASGDMPHLMWMNSLNQYIDYAKQGAFWPLDDFLGDPETLPTLTGYPNYAYDMMRVDGKIFAIPSVRISRPFNIHVRTDWLDQFGLDIPTTIDELGTVTDAFATRDPDGNGKRDTFGLMWWADPPNFESLGVIRNGFGMITTWEEIEPGRIQPVWVTEKQRNMLGWLRDGISSRVFDPDSAIMSRGDVTETKSGTGRYGVHYCDSGGQVLNALQANNPEAQLMPLSPLLTPEGEFRYGVPWVYIGMWVVTRKVKSEEDVLRILQFMDWGSSPEGSELMEFGMEGDYDVREDGSKTVNDTGTANGASALWLIPPLDPYLYVKTERNTGHPELADAQQELVDRISDQEVINPVLYTTPGPVELERGSELIQRMNEVFSLILAGQAPLSAFDDWVEEFLSSGGSEMIEERNQSYAERKPA